MARQIWLVVLAVSTQVHGVTTWHVDVDTCPAPGSGTQADPFCAIQTGINAAADGDTVLVAPGIYSETIDLLGKAIIVQSTDGPGVTTINGGGSGTTVSFVNLEGLDSVLAGFTITGGNAVEGGGMLIEFSGPLIADCVFDNNAATRGAGASIVGSTATFANCTFTLNDATDSGGGLYCNASSPILTACAFTFNTTPISIGLGGAAQCTNFSNASFSGCTFNFNFAVQGGAIANTGFSDTLISDCTYSGNQGRFGAAMYNSSSNPNITDSQFTSNHAQTLGGCCGSSDGGAIYNLSSSPHIANCTFIGNRAGGTGLPGSPQGHGSAIYNGSSGPVITNCDFTDNTANGYANAGHGGAIYHESGSTTLVSVRQATPLTHSAGLSMRPQPSPPPIATSTATWPRECSLLAVVSVAAYTRRAAASP